ncbi:MAG: glycine zipper 2TM domain-containing protein [Candidatus Thiodiazotropha sp.]
MKTKAMTIGTALMIASMTATAGGHRDHYRDTAKVIDVEPIYRSVEISYPERECWDEEVDHYHPDGSRYTPTVLGGIIGGVVANKISRGRGRGRDAATVAGALLGGAIGHDISQKHSGGHYTTSVERRCEVSHQTRYEEELVGYDVTYRYKGREFTTRTRNHPGKRIPIAVSVRPVSD